MAGQVSGYKERTKREDAIQREFSNREHKKHKIYYGAGSLFVRRRRLRGPGQGSKQAPLSSQPTT